MKTALIVSLAIVIPPFMLWMLAKLNDAKRRRIEAERMRRERAEWWERMRRDAPLEKYEAHEGCNTAGEM